MAAGGFAWWLWGWQLGSLTFHESWSREQRDDMEQIAKALINYNEHEDFIDRQLREHGQETDTSRLSRRMRDRDFLASSFELLQHVAESGRGEGNTPIGITAAYLACRLGKVQLAGELVRRGCDPNRPVIDKMGGMPESAFHAAIACVSLQSMNKDYTPPSAEQRQELLSIMLENGADISRGREMSIACAFLAYLRSTEEGPVMLEWLFDHGLTIPDEINKWSVCMMLSMENSLPTIKRLLEKGYLDANDELTKSYLLFAAAASVTPDTPEKLLWALDTLHADVNARQNDLWPKGTTRKIAATPLIINASQLSYDDIVSDDAAAKDRLVLQAMEILLSHGAKLTDEDAEQLVIPQNPELQRAFYALLAQYGIVLKQK